MEGRDGGLDLPEGIGESADDCAGADWGIGIPGL